MTRLVLKSKVVLMLWSSSRDFRKKSGLAFAGRPWRKPDSWMDSIWEDHARLELLRCLGGDVVATSRNRGANMAQLRGQSWRGGQAVPAGLRLCTRQRPCLCLCGREMSHPLQASEGEVNSRE